MLFVIAAIGSAGAYRSGPAAVPAATTPESKTVVARMWHGRTLTSKADEYYTYLKQEGIDKIEAIKGNVGAQILRRTDGNSTEFTVISYWESREAIKQFAGDDIEKTHFLPKDPQYLLELEPKVKHFDVLYDGRK
jgi:heme-degrading monooxygenase HmoA